MRMRPPFFGRKKMAAPIGSHEEHRGRQAEERSQSGDLAFIKKLAQKFLDVLEFMAPSLKHLETPDGDSKEGQQRNIADPNTSEPRLKTIEETTEPATADGGISETPEIPESASVSIREDICISSDNGIKEISSGSYGVVHLVRHKDTNKVYAMKKQARRNLDHPSYLERAYLERDIAIFSDCPFVVSTLCSFQLKKHLCMVMDFEAVNPYLSYLLSALGGDCSSLIKLYGRLPLDLARMYIAETVLAVEYLHSYGVVHRDLKPENLLISSTGHIKVTDFGLSKLGLMRPTSDIYKARTKEITREFSDYKTIGTLSYVAPEVLLLEGYGRPIDWWAIGIILYKFLTGHVPFKGRDKKIFSTESSRLLRKNPKRRLGTGGGANEIKSHPFLSKLDFENLQNQKPQFRPNLNSEEDTHYFHTGNRRLKPMHSHKGEVIGWKESLNYVLSSQRLSKYGTCRVSPFDVGSGAEPTSKSRHVSCYVQLICVRNSGRWNRDPPAAINLLNAAVKHSQRHLPTASGRAAGNECIADPRHMIGGQRCIRMIFATNTRMMSNEDHEPSPDSSLETSTKLSDVQKESSPSTNDGDSEYFTAKNNKTPSPILSVEKKNTSELKLGEEQDPEIVAETQPSRFEKKNTSELKLGEEQDPEIVAETEPSRVEKKNKSAIKLAGEKNAKIVEEREPRRRSIFRRIISSCRRGLSRAARSIRKRCIFPICH
ncbi:unnamed protein product [Ranitomeya imitator]|uniref:non-specific serine/threonine protein kinase n=1 Tax=Ranitomeya imitator TaxID=111125 RepID=A0ABN9MBQ1_9NEOB|nr:unnamed protein product [Ranitomeya imitator]